MSSLITSPEDIRHYVREAVFDAVRQELPGLVREATQKPFLTREEVKQITGWSDRTLQHLRDSRQLPFVQHGRKITYPSRGLYEFLDAHNVISRAR